MEDKATGDETYRALCDLALTLNDIAVMANLRFMLAECKPGNAAMTELRNKVTSLDASLVGLAVSYAKMKASAVK